MEEGKLANLTCVADTAASSYEWRKDNETAVVSTEQVLTLNYTDASSVAQGGYYWCIATSSAGLLLREEANVSDAVLVLFAPSFTKHPLSANAIVGETVAFSCTAVGFPTPVVEWRHLNSNASAMVVLALPVSSLVMYSDDSKSSSTLNITSVDFCDSGDYVCITQPLRLPEVPDFPTINSSLMFGSGAPISDVIPFTSLTPSLGPSFSVARLHNLSATSNAATLTGE